MPDGGVNAAYPTYDDNYPYTYLIQPSFWFYTSRPINGTAEAIQNRNALTPNTTGILPARNRLCRVLTKQSARNNIGHRADHRRHTVYRKINPDSIIEGKNAAFKRHLRGVKLVAVMGGKSTAHPQRTRSKTDW